jgi:hypothetical protein
MNKKRRKNPLKVCSQCGAKAVCDVRRTEFHDGIVIENVPATYCSNCGEELYDLATVQLIEKILAQPERYTQMVEMPVARVA